MQREGDPATRSLCPVRLTQLRAVLHTGLDAEASTRLNAVLDAVLSTPLYTIQVDAESRNARRRLRPMPEPTPKLRAPEARNTSPFIF